MKIENLDELRVLIECEHGGSLTAAARVLGVTPAAASALLKRLEAKLGTRLVERSTRALRLTPPGEAYLGYAQRALELLDEGAAHIGDDAKRLRGTIRMSGPSDLTRNVLLPWLDEFLEAHPGVELQLGVSDSLQDVVRDQVDVAVRTGELADSRLVARRLAMSHRIAVASPDYLARHGTPSDPSELANHECLSYRIRQRRETTWRFWRDDALDAAPLVVRLNGRRSVDDAEIAHRWALAGHGVLYKGELDVRANLARGALVRLFPGWVGDPLPLHAVMPSQRFLPQRVRALVDHLAMRLSS